jgi:uncharacterized membrane protein YhaH (DUF805 family)
MSNKQGSKLQTGFAGVWCAFGVISVLVAFVMQVPMRAQDHFHGIVHGGGDDACMLHIVAAYPCMLLFTLYGIASIVFTLTADTKRVRKLGFVSIVAAILLVAMWGAMAKSFDKREEQREAQRLESETAEWDATRSGSADD